MRVYVLELSDLGPGPTFDTLEAALHSAGEELRDSCVGESVALYVREMSPEAYDVLPEFEGW